MQKGSYSWQSIGSLIRPILGVGLLKLCSLLFATIASIIVARQLGPEYYGQVTFVLAVLSLLSIPSNNAMAPLLVREVSVYDQAKAKAMLFGLLSWSQRLTMLVLTLVLIPLLGWSLFEFGTGDTANGILFLVGAPLLVAWAFGGRVSNILLGMKRTVLAQCFDWFVNPAFYLLFICALWLMSSLSPVTVLASTVLAMAISVLGGYLALRRNLPAPLAPERPQSVENNWLASWRFFVLLQLASVANMRSPILMLGILSTDMEIGLLRVAENIASLLAMPLLIINIVLGPMISRLHSNGELQELQRIAKIAARLALSVTLPVGVIAILYGEWIIQTIFGDSYSDASHALTALVTAQVCNVACGSVGLVLNMSGLEKHAVKFWVLALLVNLMLCMLLIPAYGSSGAAIAIAVSTITWNILLLVFIRKSLGINVAAV